MPIPDGITTLDELNRYWWRQNWYKPSWLWAVAWNKVRWFWPSMFFYRLSKWCMKVSNWFANYDTEPDDDE